MEGTSLNVDWQPFTLQNRTYLHLAAANTKLRQHLRPNKVSFWNNLIPMLLSGPTGSGSDTSLTSKVLNSNKNGVSGSGTEQSSVHGGAFGSSSDSSADSGPSIWIFIALNVGLATVVLVLSICLLATTVQLKRYKRMCTNYDARSNILPRRV